MSLEEDVKIVRRALVEENFGDAIHALDRILAAHTELIGRAQKVRGDLSIAREMMAGHEDYDGAFSVLCRAYDALAEAPHRGEGAE